MIKRRALLSSWLAGAALAVAMTPMTAQAIAVDTELALLIDISGSVNGREFNLQRQGYVNAFRSTSVVDAITAGALGTIAVSVVYWSSANRQVQAVDWTQISDATSSSAFADTLAGAGRPYGGSTAIGSAIAFADPTFDNNGFEGTRNVIDVSGDGRSNRGISTAGARDAFLAGGGTAINGIVIGAGVGSSLFNYYQNNVQGGDRSFTLAASSFDEFGTVIQTKLIREISDVPEPNTIALLAMGLLGVGVTARRSRKQK